MSSLHYMHNLQNINSLTWKDKLVHNYLRDKIIRPDNPALPDIRPNPSRFCKIENRNTVFGIQSEFRESFY